MQEKSVDDAIRIVGDDPTLAVLVHAVASKAANDEFRLPAWIPGNIVIAHCATLCSALDDSARQHVRVETDVNFIANLGIEIGHDLMVKNNDAGWP